MQFINTTFFCPAPGVAPTASEETSIWSIILLANVVHFGGFMLLGKLYDCCSAFLDADEPTPPAARPTK